MTTVPPIKTQVSNLFGDLHKLIKNEQGHPILASPDIIKARMDTCGACEFYKQNRCVKCGCFMEAKARFTSLKCPISKW
jgi:hypothetical protein